MKDTLFATHFHLTQHTPMIHFQDTQQGVCLRASELKPKLDHFIRNDLKEVDKTLLGQTSRSFPRR